MIPFITTEDLGVKKSLIYSVFQGFSKAKSANGGLILSLSQFLILPQLPQNIKLASKVVKVDSKKSSLYLRSKSLKLTVETYLLVSISNSRGSKIM
jgi:hypothetical protein